MSDIKKINSYNSFKTWLILNEKKILLKFLTCGSVDDGKSTLIGRLLHDTKQIYEDQLFSLKNDSRRHGTQGQEIDLALIVDGLQSEREQGITIDVAYRYLSTDKRKFIIVDTPGHQQYTRNMVTGASTCDLSILLVDAEKGLSEQTYRHAFISALLGIKYLIVAVNKMDLVKYKEKIFFEIQKKFLLFSKKINKNLKFFFIPISALTGENIVFKSKNMLWYQGSTLLNFLETVEIDDLSNSEKIRFLVQYINRPNSNFRGYSGILVSGKMYVGQKIKILPENIFSYISRILIFDKDVKKADSGESITIVLKDEIDISRGDFFVNTDSKLKPVQEAIVDIVWMDNNPLKIGQSYKVKISGKKTRIYVKEILFKIDVNTLVKEETNILMLNNIGRIKILFTEPMIFDDYIKNKVTGNLIFIDFLQNTTVAAGMIKKSVKNKESNVYNTKKDFESDLYNLIVKYFPHWNIKR
ncbi:sulfate adenylyltransferase subunit CysN [Buchnera aphidicola (Melanaphis sacchari)]|uniref:Sulfate adenylyltransferase subunit 1 n=1 Tax=Buchnera aphidicola (Melanaphis sacchari) TaxID=2173854 RepID=A0A2U8DF94_9GAMM|nr:sulfate adenylyltransferase subunit CysN [Buchnera aphidicola]AWH90377.1 sulfate adenylyltransferase subunit CysN [Buchnera aphidicola (Melanaphis sacchari)]